MPELRKDPILGRWIIISTERAARPNDFVHADHKRTSKGACPFCVGNEEMTPPEIITIPHDLKGDDRHNWRVRVVPNKYPALRIEGELNKMGDGIYDRMNGIGAHEVIIETPRHEVSLSGLTNRE
ncbi:galactose-1-phosphate uridylyltransferase, partial [candidate division KSB1 bacterium]